VPLYLWYFGIDWFQFAALAVLLTVTGCSITLGYHRLFSHLTFRASLPVRLFTLIFGAAAFENSVLLPIARHNARARYCFLVCSHTVSLLRRVPQETIYSAQKRLRDLRRKAMS